MKFLMFAASLQENSVNKRLIRLAAKIIQEQGHKIDLANFNEFEAPLYNADTQNNVGFPETILDFIKRMHQADGLIMSVPEYNFSIPGTLKNLIDWVSRITPMPWRKQYIQLLSASPSLVGGNRGLWSTRVPLESCGALVVPDMFSLANAYEAFTLEGQLANPNLNQLLTKMLDDFSTLIEKINKN